MVFLLDHVECSRQGICWSFLKTDSKKILFKFLLHLVYSTVQDLFSFVDKNNVVANFFHLFHAVRTEYDAATFLCEIINFVFDEVGINGIKTTKRFIKNNQFWLMQNSGHELQFLPHSFTEVFHFLIPPT